MRRSRSPIGFIILLLIALAVVAGVFFIASQQQDVNKQQQAANPPRTVYQPLETIPAFTILSPENVRRFELPGDQVAVGEFIENGNEVYGKMSREPLYAGASIRKGQIAEPGMSSFIVTVGPNETPSITNTHRLVSLPVGDETGVAGLVADGDLIDILFSLRFDVTPATPTADAGNAEANNIPAPQSQNLLASKTMLQGIRVVRVIQLPNPPNNKEVPRHQSDPSQTVILMLDVTPEQAELIKFMRDTYACTPNGQCNYTNGPGGMSITLRNRTDTTTFDLLAPPNATPEQTLGGIDARTLIEKYGMKAPNLIILDTTPTAVPQQP